MSNSTQELIDKLRQKQIEQEAIIEQELQKSLMTLTQNIEQRFAAVNNLIDKNTDGLKLKLQKFKFKPWIYPLIASLLLLPTIYAAAKYWDLTIAVKVKRVQTLNKTLETHNKALEDLGPAGIKHVFHKNEHYLVLPKNAKEPTTYKGDTGEWVVNLGE